MGWSLYFVSTVGPRPQGTHPKFVPTKFFALPCCLSFVNLMLSVSTSTLSFVLLEDYVERRCHTVASVGTKVLLVNAYEARIKYTR